MKVVPLPTTLDAVRISPAGAVLGSGVSVAVLPNSEPTRYVTLAFDGSQYLLVYLLTGASNGLALWGQFLSPTSGQPTGAAFAIAPSATPLANPTLGFDGTNFLLVWDDWNRGGTESVLALRLSPTGAPLDTNPVALLSVSGMQSGDVRETLPAIAFDGTNYLVAYRDFRPVFTGASPILT